MCCSRVTVNKVFSQDRVWAVNCNSGLYFMMFRMWRSAECKSWPNYFFKLECCKLIWHFSTGRSPDPVQFEAGIARGFACPKVKWYVDNAQNRLATCKTSCWVEVSRAWHLVCRSDTRNNLPSHLHRINVLFRNVNLNKAIKYSNI